MASLSAYQEELYRIMYQQQSYAQMPPGWGIPPKQKDQAPEPIQEQPNYILLLEEDNETEAV